MLPILVYGYYGHSNIGDELFKNVFQKMFPNYRFIFSDIINNDLLEKTSSVFFGGGSFLFSDTGIDHNCLNQLQKKYIFYLGVGGETDIHPIHQKLMKLAQLIAVRSLANIEYIKSLNSKTIYIPDLIFFLKPKISSEKIKKSVLIIPNMSVIPMHDEPHWKHISFSYFKNEFSQFLDYLIEDGYKIGFLPMSIDPMFSDRASAIEIINAMKHRDDYHLPWISYFPSLTELISQYETVISQRYHGAILAEMCRVPYISLFHHDKLKNNYYNRGISIPYYGIYKSDLISKFNELRSMNLPLLPEEEIFNTLRQAVEIIDG